MSFHRQTKGRQLQRPNSDPPQTASTSSSSSSSSVNRRQSIFGKPDSSANVDFDNIDEYSIELPCKLTDFKPSLRGSMPNIPTGRLMSAGSTGSRSRLPTDTLSENGSFYNLRSLSFNKSATIHTQGSIVDSNHIHLFLPKRDSITFISQSTPTVDSFEEKVTQEVQKLKISTQKKPEIEDTAWRQIDEIPDNTTRCRSHYIGELVFQINDFVYCGGIDASLNHNLLCRLNIEFIIDLSGPDADRTARTRTEVPCLCGARTAHSRTTLSISIKDESFTTKNALPRAGNPKNYWITEENQRQDLSTYFEEVIVCIEKAKAANKSVLIHSVRCRNRAPAFVAAYLMKIEKLTRVQAINRLTQIIEKQLKASKIRPGLCIADNLQRALMKWQSKLNIQGTDSSNDPIMMDKLFSVRKTAWN